MDLHSCGKHSLRLAITLGEPGLLFFVRRRPTFSSKVRRTLKRLCTSFRDRWTKAVMNSARICGRVTGFDRKGLETMICECYFDIRQIYEALNDGAGKLNGPVRGRGSLRGDHLPINMEP